MKELLFRGSYNEGFRAPSFFQLYTQQGLAQVPGNIADPVLCPNGPGPGADLSVCAIRPNGLQGGNPNLQPETSEQYSIGFVVEPTNWFSASVDWWEIERSDRIYELTPQQVVANYTTFPNALVRGPNGRLDEPGGFIRAGFVNADGDITRGTDVSVQLRGQLFGPGKWSANLDGTYIDSFKSRIFKDSAYNELVGKYNSRDLYVRWKHTLTVNYTQGPWSSTFYQQYTDGYQDEKPLGVIPPGFNPEVDNYITYGFTVTYTGFQNTTLSFGVKNLFDEDPPFTAHNVDFAAGAGWDPRVADPRGRSYLARVAYKF
jgi:iron complex outermembrane receptor protein